MEERFSAPWAQFYLPVVVDCLGKVSVVVIAEPAATVTTSSMKLYQKASHRCKRHPLEAVGLYLSDILKKAGAPSSTSPAFCEQDKIDFRQVEKKLNDLLSADIWDDVGVHMLRNIEDIQDRVNRVVKV